MIGVPKHSFRPVINDGSTAVPPHGIMHVTRIDSEGFAHVSEPTLATPIELILVNSSSGIEQNGRGSGHQIWPANVAYDERTGDTPSNGETWGIEIGNWKLVKCMPGFIIVGGAGHGAVTVVPQYIRRVKAQVIAINQEECGNSGSTSRSGTTLSGSNSTDHTIYTYGLHSVHAIDDGDGCQSWSLDDVDIAVIIEDAFEQNNNLVPRDTIVDAELVAYTDESLSGSEYGAASGSRSNGLPGCRWVFKHDSVPIAESSGGGKSGYRYFCVTGINKEYWQNSDGTLEFIRNNGCCDCSDSGSTSGSDECNTCDSPDDVLCLRIEPWGSFSQCDPPSEITLEYVGSSDGIYDNWRGSINYRGYLWTVDYRVYCQTSPELLITITDGPTTVCMMSSVQSAWSSVVNCSFPTTGTLSHQFCSQVYNPGMECQSDFTISVGECPTDQDDAGSGSGQCPCLWQWNGILPWVLVSGDSGTCVAPMSSGVGASELRYTNSDGTTCIPGEGDDGEDLACACVGDKLATATLQAGFLADVPGSAMRLELQDDGTFCFWQSIADVFTACGTGNRSIMAWEESGRMYATIVGSGQVFEAETGATCDAMTFNFSYTTSNTICPGLTGSMTLSVVTE